MSASPQIDATRCPLCGQPNHCLLAAGAHSNEECWCFRVRFPASLLARVPEPARRRACICPQCANGGVRIASCSGNAPGDR